MRIVVYNHLSGRQVVQARDRAFVASAVKPRSHTKRRAHRTTDCGDDCDCHDCSHQRDNLWGRASRDAVVGEWYFLEASGSPDQLRALRMLVRRLGGAEIGSVSGGGQAEATFRVPAARFEELKRGAATARVNTIRSGPY